MDLQEGIFEEEPFEQESFKLGEVTDDSNIDFFPHAEETAEEDEDDLVVNESQISFDL